MLLDSQDWKMIYAPVYKNWYCCSQSHIVLWLQLSGGKLKPTDLFHKTYCQWGLSFHTCGVGCLINSWMQGGGGDGSNSDLLELTRACIAPRSAGGFRAPAKKLNAHIGSLDKSPSVDPHICHLYCYHSMRSKKLPIHRKGEWGGNCVLEKTFDYDIQGEAKRTTNKGIVKFIF